MPVMEREQELRLVEGLRRRDSAAFEAVHEAFHARLFGFLARLSGNRDVAEDLAEETWLRLVTHAARLRPDTNLAAWIFTVARNLHTSYCRSRLIEDSLSTGTLGLWPSTAMPPSPLESATASETAARLAMAFRKLPLLYREALLLAAEGMRPSEAAVVCGVTPEAMRQRLSRARAQLDDRLAKTTAFRLTSLQEVVT
jgi:RNA polymerase sigma-70 factor (ECF subfamily)